MTRMYNVVVINEKTGLKTRMNAAPVTHAEGCTWLAKISDLQWRRKQLEEIPETPLPSLADLEYWGIGSDGLASYSLPFDL